MMLQISINICLQGIVPLSFPLSDEPVAGVWNVSVFALYPPAVVLYCLKVFDYCH